jgi:acyl-CoA synthetase (AMP-forming)/AMP-acid ligase II
MAKYFKVDKRGFALEAEHSHFDTLVDLLHIRAVKQPNQTAFTFLVDGENKEVNVNYNQLDLQAKAIAIALQENGVLPGQRALLLYPSGLDYIAAFFGCLYAGVIAVPAYPPRHNDKMQRLKSIIANAEVSVVLTVNSLLENIQKSLVKNLQLEQLLYLATDTLPNRQTCSWEKPELNDDTVAFLQYTSGSTGIPKGVMVSHKNILYNQKMIKEAFEHTAKTVFVGWLPLFHDMGLIGNVLQPVYLGIHSILMSPENFIKKPIRWLNAISRYAATTSGGPNFGYNLCLQSITPEQRQKIDLSSWEVAFNGAEPVLNSTILKFSSYFSSCGFSQKVFYPCYGMAEATLFISGGSKSKSPIVCNVKKSALEEGNIVAAKDVTEDTRTLVSCGQSWLDQKIAVVNPNTFALSPSNTVGEIWISGLNVARGYWNQLEKTQQTFDKRLVNSHESFLRTGDMGFIKDGELFVTGRLKDLIIIRGRNYYPQDIELTVEQSDTRFRQSSGAVFTVRVGDEEKLVAIQEIKREYLKKVDVKKLEICLRRAVAQDHGLQISDILIVKPLSILKTSSGKIRRSACKKKYLDKEFLTIGKEEKNN